MADPSDRFDYSVSSAVCLLVDIVVLISAMKIWDVAGFDVKAYVIKEQSLLVDSGATDTRLVES
jgi:hypothetical protein